jgi:hypothetical protein
MRDMMEGFRGRNQELEAELEEARSRVPGTSSSTWAKEPRHKPKVKEPERFTGTKGEDWHAWSRSVMLYLRRNRVEREDEMIEIVLSYLGGAASQTAQPYFHMMEQGEELGTFEAFMQSLTAVYGQTDRESVAKAALAELKMTGSAAEYAAEFIRHAQLTRFSDYDK